MYDVIEVSKMQKSVIAKIIEILLIILLIGGMLCFFFIPELYNYFKEDSVTYFYNQSTYYKIAFYGCYIICLTIFGHLIVLFHQVYNHSPFQKEVVIALNNSAILFMLLFIIVILKAFLIPTLLSFVCAFICFMVSLSFYVLKEVIKSAIVYKNEVDYTV